MMLLALLVLIAIPLSFLLAAIGFILGARLLTSQPLTLRDGCALTLSVALLSIASLVLQGIVAAAFSDPAQSVLNVAIGIGTLALVVGFVRNRLQIGIARAIGVWAVASIFSVVAALVVRSSLIQAFWVPSGAMLPTIQIGDHIFVDKRAYSLHLPLMGEPMKTGELQRGDVVAFVSPIDPATILVKRVIAVPGDTVEIRNKQLYINGEQASDSHANFTDSSISASGPRDNMPPREVPEGKFFTMGDNRDRSYDSRFWGFANLSDIKGKVTVVYWSADNGTPRWERIGQYIE